MSFRDQPGWAVAAVAGLYAATTAGLGLVTLLAAVAWTIADATTRRESTGLVVIIVAAALVARLGPWMEARRVAARVFRYVVWVPMLLGGPAGLAVLGIWWAIVTCCMLPRAPRPGHAGLALEPERQRALVELAGRAAQTAGVTAADRIDLDLSARVAVEARGKSVLLGLYALAVLEPAELGALLTHEFAHHAPGRFAYQLHERMYGLLGRPAELDYGSYLFFPRLALGLRATLRAARRQEAEADARAAAAWGRAALDRGRLRLAVAAAAQGPYHQQVVAPVLLLGSRPALVEGLRHWLAGDDADGALRAARLELTPRLMPRWAAHAPRPEAAEALAFELAPEAATVWGGMESPWLVEEKLVQALGVHLKPVAWEGVARELYLHNWEQVLSDHGERLRGWTPRLYPELCRDLDAVGRRLLQEDAGKFMPAYRIQMAETILGISLAMCVKRAGWNVYDLPGQPLWLERQEQRGGLQRIEPFALVTGLQAGKTSPEAFLAECAQAGILDADISGGRT